MRDSRNLSPEDKRKQLDALTIEKLDRARETTPPAARK